MTALFVYIALTLGVSFVCSILEAMLLSITPSYVAAMEVESPKVGARLAALKQNIDRPLAAILALNTIANTIGASGIGAQVLKLYGDTWVALASFVLTIVILYFSEITPKTLGAKYWRQLAPMASALIPVMIVVTLPLVWPSKFLVRLMGSQEGPTLSREEFSAMANMAADEGMFHEKESLIIRNLGKFSSLVAKDIMTPRTVLVALNETLTVDEVMEGENGIEQRFTRFPVYDGTVDNITGFVHKHELLLKYARDEGVIQLRDFRRPILVMPAMAKLPDLFEQMLKRKEHLVLLVDEYGGTAGIASMEDVVETLLGMEIQDEFDEVDDMRALARQQWRRRAEALGILAEISDASDDEQKVIDT